MWREWGTPEMSAGRLPPHLAAGRLVATCPPSGGTARRIWPYLTSGAQAPPPCSQPVLPSQVLPGGLAGGSPAAATPRASRRRGGVARHGGRALHAASHVPRLFPNCPREGGWQGQAPAGEGGAAGRPVAEGTASWRRGPRLAPAVVRSWALSFRQEHCPARLGAAGRRRVASHGRRAPGSSRVLGGSGSGVGQHSSQP